MSWLLLVELVLIIEVSLGQIRHQKRFAGEEEEEDVEVRHGKRFVDESESENEYENGYENGYEELELPCGEIIIEGDENYTEANNMYWNYFDNKTTLGIIFAECENDVIASINYIYENNISFRVRSGRHSYGGYSTCDGCLVIDLSRMNNAKFLNNYKTNEKYFIAEPGMVLREVVESLKEHNVIIPHGACPTTGLSGITLGGGIAFSIRYFGLMIDYVIGVRVVLANGEVKEIIDPDYEEFFLNAEDTKSIYSSSNYNKNNHHRRHHHHNKITDEDLLWALKGNGHGNYGVVTKIYYNTIPQPTYINGFKLDFIYDINTSYLFLEKFQDFFNASINEDLTDEISCALILYPNFEDSRYYPLYYTWSIVGFDFTNNHELLNDLIDYLPYNYTQLNLTDSYYDFYQDIVFSTITAQNDAAGYVYPSPISRMTKTSFNNETLNLLINYFNDAINNDNMLINGGSYLTFYYIPFGSMIKTLDPDNLNTSFGGRDYFANTEFTVGPLYQNASFIEYAYNQTYYIKNNILDHIGNYVYVNYMDIVQNNISYYFPNNHIFNQLKSIKSYFDPDNFFNYDLSIPLN